MTHIRPEAVCLRLSGESGVFGRISFTRSKQVPQLYLFFTAEMSRIKKAAEARNRPQVQVDSLAVGFNSNPYQVS